MVDRPNGYSFFLYCLIGFSGVTLDFLIYTGLIYLGFVTYQQANATGYLAGTILSFLLNARLNFRVNDRLLSRFCIFLSVALVGYLTSALLLHGLVEFGQADRFTSKAATLVAVVMLQYNLNRLYSFRQT